MKRLGWLLCLSFMLIFTISGCSVAGTPSMSASVSVWVSVSATTPPSPAPTITSSPSHSATIQATPTRTPTPRPTGPKLDSNLCASNEILIMSFRPSGSDKKASICVSKKDANYIVYRFGTPDWIELEFPDKAPSSWDLFSYSFCYRGGGVSNEELDLNHLDFEISGYQYQVYEEYAAAADQPLVGIVVKNMKTGKKSTLKGNAKSLKGSMIGLRSYHWRNGGEFLDRM